MVKKASFRADDASSQFLIWIDLAGKFAFAGSLGPRGRAIFVFRHVRKHAEARQIRICNPSVQLNFAPEAIEGEVSQAKNFSLRLLISNASSGLLRDLLVAIVFETTTRGWRDFCGARLVLDEGFPVIFGHSLINLDHDTTSCSTFLYYRRFTREFRGAWLAKTPSACDFNSTRRCRPQSNCDNTVA
jgi:hypothetical protein